jgi:acetyl-CoA acetyltransferase
MSETVYVAGVGMTPFGKFLEIDIKALTRTAVDAALADAGADAGGLQAAFFANCSQGHMEGQDMVRGQVALRAMGIERIPVVNVENACASGSTALHLAVGYVRAGGADIALAIGAEKMYAQDKQRTFGIFDGAWDVHTIEENQRRLLALGEGVEVPAGSRSPKPYSVFMDIYAAFGRMHMRDFGTTQRQLAAVAAKNHAHSVHNDRAQYRDPYSIEQVLAAAPITFPLTLPMCAPVSDGAAAAIVCSERGLARLNGSRRRAVRVLASVLVSGAERPGNDLTQHIGRRGATLAYAQAGVGPQEISVAEVHDATAIGEILQIEALGFCPLGEGGPVSERGETRLGGRLPVNPSGGLECKGHPIGATGIAQVFELVSQLRGEAGPRQVDGARIAMAENGGGLIGVEEAAACFTILGR